MATLKRNGFFLAETIAAAVLIIWTLDAFGYRSPVAAFLINWLAMSWIALAGMALEISFPAKYYAAHAFERGGKVYERLGILPFKRLVRRGPLAIFSPTLRFPKEKTISALRQLEHEMEKAETSHVVIFAIMLFFISYALLRGWFDAVGWILLFNLLINGYPIMLQRYNRIKLEELIQR